MQQSQTPRERPGCRHEPTSPLRVTRSFVLHARSFQEIIERERAAPTLLPCSVCATAGCSLASGSDIGSVSPEQSLKAALSELHTGPAAASSCWSEELLSR